MILEKTYDLLKSRYNVLTDKLVLAEVIIGKNLLAVMLSDGSCGVAGTYDEFTPCLKENRDYGEFTPSKIKGRRVIDLLETAKKSDIIGSLRIAVFNALSSRVINNSDYKIHTDKDPVDLIDLNSSKTIAMVGAFGSAITKISSTSNTLYVLELNKAALRDEHQKYFVPASRYTDILPSADVVLITGSALVNHTMEGLLSVVTERSMLAVTGPSCSILPDVWFSYGVKIVGATRITNPDLMFSVVREGGTGYHLFNYCAQKICILNE